MSSIQNRERSHSSVAIRPERSGVHPNSDSKRAVQSRGARTTSPLVAESVTRSKSRVPGISDRTWQSLYDKKGTEHYIGLKSGQVSVLRFGPWQRFSTWLGLFKRSRVQKNRLILRSLASEINLRHGREAFFTATKTCSDEDLGNYMVSLQKGGNPSSDFEKRLAKPLKLWEVRNLLKISKKSAQTSAKKSPSKPMEVLQKSMQFMKKAFTRKDGQKRAESLPSNFLRGTHVRSSTSNPDMQTFLSQTNENMQHVLGDEKGLAEQSGIPERKFKKPRMEALKRELSKACEKTVLKEHRALPKEEILELAVEKLKKLSRKRISRIHVGNALAGKANFPTGHDKLATPTPQSGGDASTEGIHDSNGGDSDGGLPEEDSSPTSRNPLNGSGETSRDGEQLVQEDSSSTPRNPPNGSGETSRHGEQLVQLVQEDSSSTSRTPLDASKNPSEHDRQFVEEVFTRPSLQNDISQKNFGGPPSQEKELLKKTLDQAQVYATQRSSKESEPLNSFEAKTLIEVAAGKVLRQNAGVGLDSFAETESRNGVPATKDSSKRAKNRVVGTKASKSHALLKTSSSVLPARTSSSDSASPTHKAGSETSHTNSLQSKKGVQEGPRLAAMVKSSRTAMPPAREVVGTASTFRPVSLETHDAIPSPAEIPSPAKKATTSNKPPSGPAGAPSRREQSDDPWTQTQKTAHTFLGDSQALKELAQRNSIAEKKLKPERIEALTRKLLKACREKASSEKRALSRQEIEDLATSILKKLSKKGVFRTQMRNKTSRLFGKKQEKPSVDAA